MLCFGCREQNELHVAMLSSLNQVSGVHVVDRSMIAPEEVLPQQQHHHSDTVTSQVVRTHSDSPGATRKMARSRDAAPETGAKRKNANAGKEAAKASASSGAIRTMLDDASSDEDDFRARPPPKADSTVKKVKSASQAKRSSDSPVETSGGDASERVAVASTSSMAQKLKLRS